ncbi:hypothetical protein PF023_06405 [Enterococcus thailandicus]|uniref:hypothetical protein n=1 Tax=Enterococcus thailandicus TaxID=417368 RepID=UPI0022EC0BE5|nr:hypothetical protein [Enterococcus thailandicus]MDA3973670.1 hypothetical protein [Enterococcus thailandicus]MDA3975747.1 hypothetical protein [Enterococcus thailandicus]MDA3981127.1 hypothetical protein [Enterococcus thailandicus]
MVEQKLEQKTDKKKKRRLLILLLLLLVALAAFFSLYFFRETPKVISGLPDVEQNLEKMTDEEMLKFMQSEVDKDNFNINLKHEITVSKENNIAQIAVKNKPTNAYSIQVEYLLKDGNKQIYKSGLIPANRQLMEAKLTENLSEGSHEVMIVYTIFDDEKEINQSTIDGVLYVS